MAELKIDSFSYAPEGHKISLLIRESRQRPVTTEKAFEELVVLSSPD